MKQPEVSAQAPEGEESGWGEEGADELGFGDAAPPPVEVPAQAPAALPAEDAPSLDAAGFARSEWGLWGERLGSEPLAKARQSLDLSARYRSGRWRALVSGHVEYDLAYAISPGLADPAEREVYESLAELRETYVQGAFGPFDVTVGRQIVAWGEGDIFSPLDVVNPRDLREPGLADLDDLRLPVLSTRVGLFAGDHRFEAMVIHLPEYGYRSPPLGEFSPLGAVIREAVQPVPTLAALVASAPARYQEEPGRFGLNHQQYLARWVYRGPSIDLALYAASVLDRQGVVTRAELETTSTADLLAPSAPSVSQALALRQEHLRYLAAGHSGALPLGGWLLKWELFGNFGRAFNAGTLELPDLQLRGEAVNLAGAMAGVTFTGISNLRVDVEATKAWLLSSATDLLFAADEPSAAVRVAYNFPQQHLSFEGMAMVLGWLGRQGWLARASVSYSVLDGLALSLGGIHYGPGPEVGPLTGFDAHDRITFKARYDFTL